MGEPMDTLISENFRQDGINQLLRGWSVSSGNGEESDHPMIGSAGLVPRIITKPSRPKVAT
ncbi:MAG: hypothetical protein PHD25_12565 [Bacteroidales bacterium]|nr:hypothetical protein [Bacteroidales bacterium]